MKLTRNLLEPFDLWMVENDIHTIHAQVNKTPDIRQKYYELSDDLFSKVYQLFKTYV